MFRNFGITCCAACIIVILCLWIPTPGSALKCHVCNSLDNETCDDLKDNRFLVDCYTVNSNPERNHSNCRKEVFSAYSAAFGMNTQRTFRTCGYEKHPRFSCFYSSNIDLKGTTCECTEDGCNEGSTLQFTMQSFCTVIFGLFLSFIIT
ncbi:uncharacterized protein LOC118197682 [Stegodyphus dumicola]|uniref:uncharacterized protein LOC118197682 n=1 Tax=Stegodyphus dumicola TaxID=202533 RepID=UPI0015B26E37|nr:uncharacterized protein LOC118197682 [Stegodyphus dumicola]